MTKLLISAAATLCAAALLGGCQQKTAETAAKPAAPAAAAPAAQAPAKAAQVVIYTNADEEAQVAMKHALDNNGFKGAYLMQGFGTSELGGKLAAEGKNIEADVVTLSTYYLDSLQKKEKLFQKLNFPVKTKIAFPDYYDPILANTGALFVNTEVLKADNLPRPTSIVDLAKPIYKGHISVPDIMGSSTSWLMTQAVISEKGEKEGAAIVHQIEENAGPHLEKSGSGPLKKIRAGEVAIGFGLRHQAVADKAKGLPIDFIDPTEGNFTLYEAAAVIDKGAKTNPNAQKVVETIIKYARPELIKYYPAAIYDGEKVDPANEPAHPKAFKEPLTVELLQQHQKLVKGTN